MGYVYIRSEPRLWTVGFYEPSGKFVAESDHAKSEDAARRVAWLNGSGKQQKACGFCGTDPCSCKGFPGSHDFT